MPRPLFTSANAREMAAKAHEARRQRTLALQVANATEPQSTQPATILAFDPYVNNLVCAQNELLAELRASESAKDKAALAQALKNLREVYHQATGKPKPGTIKPERVSSRQSVKQPAEPRLDTTDCGPANPG